MEVQQVKNINKRREDDGKEGTTSNQVNYEGKV